MHRIKTDQLTLRTDYSKCSQCQQDKQRRSSFLPYLVLVLDQIAQSNDLLHLDIQVLRTRAGMDYEPV